MNDKKALHYQVPMITHIYFLFLVQLFCYCSLEAKVQDDDPYWKQGVQHNVLKVRVTSYMYIEICWYGHFLGSSWNSALMFCSSFIKKFKFPIVHDSKGLQSCIFTYKSLFEFWGTCSSTHGLTLFRCFGRFVAPLPRGGILQRGSGRNICLEGDTFIQKHRVSSWIITGKC